MLDVGIFRDATMANIKGKDTGAVEDIDIDYLLETLSPEELEKLGEELIDPDVSLMFKVIKVLHNHYETLNTAFTPIGFRTGVVISKSLHTTVEVATTVWRL